MAKPIIEEQHITQTLETNYMPYAMSVIISRAIPEIDGFKPSHRKLLYTMYKMGLLNSARTKSANVVGQTMKLNPHGDMAIYETLVRLTEGNSALIHPFIDSKGNFGKQFSRDMAYAASRYTEVKLAGICAEVFNDIDKNTVDFIDNYDGTMKEPSLLPTTYPNVLVNSNQGIAVGMASNICSFNLKEICETTVMLLDDYNADFTKILTAPDFSTGGAIIYNENEMRDIYETGRGTFKVRSKYAFDKQNNCIDVFEIPYTTTVEAIIDKVVELVKTGKIKEISDIRDETDLNGLKITIDLKRGCDPDNLMERLFKLTPLQDSFGCNFNILVEGSPMVLGVRDIITEWIRFRISCLKRSMFYDIQKKSDKLHLLRGLEKILLDIDKAIKIVRETKEERDVIPNLMAGFDIDEIQAEYVAEIKLRNLNQEYILKRISEIQQLVDEIANLKDTVNDEKKIKKIIASQLKEISKKYGTERKTSIMLDTHIEQITDDHFIEDYQLKLFRTKHNYLKKISLSSLRSSGEQKLKEDDDIIQEFETSNKSEVLLFSDSGNVYKIRAHEIPDCKASTLGEYMPNLLGMNDDENIIGMVATEDFSGFMLFCFENGKIAKIELKSYATKLNRKKLTGAYSKSSKLIKIIYAGQDMELAAFSNIGKVLVFNTEHLAIKSTRDSQGVSVLTSRKGSFMVDVKTLDEAQLGDPNYYKTKNIPAIGCFIKEEDKGARQMSLF